jgi:hypothetical protein
MVITNYKLNILNKLDASQNLRAMEASHLRRAFKGSLS